MYLILLFAALRISRRVAWTIMARTIDLTANCCSLRVKLCINIIPRINLSFFYWSRTLGKTSTRRSMLTVNGILYIYNRPC